MHGQQNLKRAIDVLTNLQNDRKTNLKPTNLQSIALTCKSSA